GRGPRAVGNGGHAWGWSEKGGVLWGVLWGRHCFHRWLRGRRHHSGPDRTRWTAAERPPRHVRDRAGRVAIGPLRFIAGPREALTDAGDPGHDVALREHDQHLLLHGHRHDELGT